MFTERLTKAIEELGFDEYKQIQIDDIIFSEDVFKQCAKNVCGNFGKNHGCPPNAGNQEDGRSRILKFHKAILLNKILPIRSRQIMKESGETLERLKNDLIKKFAGEPLLVLGVGPCKLCTACTALEGMPCRFPEKIHYSMEGSGIDVMRMSMNHKMKYNAGMGNVGFFMLVLYNE